MPNNRWLEFSIRASAEAAEALTAVFEKSGQGVVIEPEFVQGDEADIPIPAPGQYSHLRTYIPEGKDLAARSKAIEDAVGILRAFELAPMGDLQHRWVDEEEWESAWKHHYQVQRLGRRWIVKPSWQDYDPKPEDRVIELDPGMAFGTGLHPTTQTVLEVLEDLAGAGEVEGKRLLDLGTGSGILTIGAVKAGASSVLSLDVEEVAVRAAAENVAKNGAADRVEVRHATLGQTINGVITIPGIGAEDAFDGILANIVARVIAERAPAIGRALRPGGWLIASGIIQERERDATDALEANGLTLERREERGDWRTLLYRK
ncbi:MAG TPA: 50S ribosomal protein L11 methyltransferase [Chloroflexota bacterium]|nr:50S ribosomal protein L11 methyltransferase [Chloroflexota bacterium]